MGLCVASGDLSSCESFGGWKDLEGVPVVCQENSTETRRCHVWTEHPQIRYSEIPHRALVLTNQIITHRHGSLPSGGVLATSTMLATSKYVTTPV